MTRYTRAGNTQKHQKVPENATPWKEFFSNTMSKSKDLSIHKVKTGKIEKKKQKKLAHNDKRKMINKTKIKEIEDCTKLKKIRPIINKQLKTEVSNSQQKIVKEKEELQESMNAVNLQCSNSTEITENFTNLSVPRDSKDNVRPFMKNRSRESFLLLPPNMERKLYKIKKKLRKNGEPEEVIKQIARKERRKAELNHRNASRKICFKCRQKGHCLSECPLSRDKSNQETGICFKCGSTEHVSYKCKQKVEGYPFAKCFICNEQGHISRDCPQNKHGIYPKGGKCNLCGNVNHLRKDCPTLKKKESEEEITLDTINKEKSVDAEVIHDQRTVGKKEKEKKKIITFL
ncbi:zinc finger CCHC domain-containing protein 9 [Nephila pilipes]|uniref:Zinc finger CCHC domain-containing protein 9 n=1 Tax=Nephila pilipes TaxID=299642 RepID=A0A8X6PX46_NEPPI|nr:zinc finger CCHC domain-containing protein 9 [Nephila pilipes]